jgi:Ca2+-binding EF-hand superfamily protein
MDLSQLVGLAIHSRPETKGRTMSTISGISSASSTWSQVSVARTQRQEKLFAKVDANGSGGVDQTELQGLLDEVAKKTGVASAASAADLFGKMDSNGDGSLSKDELGKGMKDILPPPSTMDFAKVRSDSGSAKTDELFSKVDSNGDGAVSKTELQSLLDKFAADSTGSASSSSGTTSSSSTSSTTSDLFAKLDTNGDGSLSQTEFDAARNQGSDQATPTSAAGHGPHGAGGPPPPPPAAGGAGGSTTSFDPLDTNQDGVVSAAERLAGSTKSDALQALFKAIDSNGDKQISSSESDAFVKELTAQLQATTATTSSSDSGTASGTASKQETDFAKLVTKAYEQIASGLAQQLTGSTVNAVA